MRKLPLLFLFIVFSGQLLGAKEEILKTEVCVYGGTASGVAAALAAKRRGHDVVIVEPMRFLGGMHGGGIRIQQDCLYLDDIGGIAKELHQADYALGGTGSSNQWAARRMIRRKVEEAGIRYFTEHRIDSREDVVMDGTAIRRIHVNYAPFTDDEGVPPARPARHRVLSIEAEVFVDASYEGDLMAYAGCEYRMGRESRGQYGESLAGQGDLIHFDVDPYLVPGDSSSGVLPFISTEPYEKGGASRYHMTYNFRLPGFFYIDREDSPKELTTLKPLGREIDRDRYELVIRGLKAKGDGENPVIGWPFWNLIRNAMVGSGPPGRQIDYPDADWTGRAQVWRDWIDHVKTMNELCGVDNRMLLVGEYPHNGDFPDQLYIRVGRRLVGEYIMTQADLMHQTVIGDSIGLGYYGVDLYPPRLLAHDGKVALEGVQFIRVSPGPYPISYRSLLPKEDQCTNLIVPVCISGSHVALASIRMESTYVVMGEAAGIAASHALTSDNHFHDVDIADLHADMKKAGVVISWGGTGYGPDAPRHWDREAIYWRIHPEAYQAIPIRLDSSWKEK